MKPLGSVEFTIEELPDKLQIRYARHAGWIERIVAPVVVASSMVIGWFWQKPVLIAGASGLIILLILRWAWGHESVLRIFPERLIASSYLLDTIETSLSSVQTIRWLSQNSWDGEGVGEGLYISRAGLPECILPFASKEQAKAITDAISRLFPHYPVNKPIPGSIWFEELPDMTAFTIPSRTDPAPTKRT
jgi:hypothetical protein